MQDVMLGDIQGIGMVPGPKGFPGEWRIMSNVRQGAVSCHLLDW